MRFTRMKSRIYIEYVNRLLFLFDINIIYFYILKKIISLKIF